MIDEVQDVKTPAMQNQWIKPPSQNDEESVGFFQEDNGSYSSMRLMCFVSMVTAMNFGLITLWIFYKGGNDGGNGLLLAFGFLVGAFAPKAVQKFAEQKVDPKG